MGDNWHNRSWMFLPVGGAEDVETNSAGRGSVSHDFSQAAEKQVTESLYPSDPREQ